MRSQSLSPLTLTERFMSKEYRFSSYSIVVPLDSEPENVFMMHGYTGAIDVLNKEIAEYLQGHDHFSKKEVPCSETTVEALEKRGYITKWSREEEVEYAKRLANALFRKETFLYHSFTFVVGYNCNFRCPYCFEKGIGGLTSAFTTEMVDKAYMAIKEIAPKKEFLSKTISLYGGEPLLKENKNTVSYIVQKGIKNGFDFFAVTNGYDLDYYEDLLGPNGISALQITIDGLKERHNNRRVHYLGIPTFDKIVANIGLALKKGVGVVVRVNTDKDNIEDLENLQKLFESLHYTENKLFSMNSALLRNYSNSVEEYSYLTPHDFIKRFEKLSFKYSCQDYGLQNRIKTAIKFNVPILLKSHYCGSQIGSYVFDPYGDIYPCWEVVGQKEHRIGSYLDDKGILWNPNVEKKWRMSTLMKTNCIKCKFALLCGGGCLVHRNDNSFCTRIEEFVKFSINKAIISTK